VHETKFLIITSSAGGGLLQAAAAQRQHLLARDPDAKTIQKDVLKDWVWKWLGEFSIESWNRAQKKGDVRSQKFFASCHWLFDYIAWPSVFFHTLRILFKENLDRVIDTQTTSTSAIVKAIRFFNWKRSKCVILEKLIVDLPTKKATHFFRPIRALSKKDKKLIKVRTIPPLLEEGQTSKQFWRKHCDLCESEIDYEDVHVRLPFKALQGKPRPSNDMTLSFETKNLEEKALMDRAFKKGASKVVTRESHLEISVPQEARVISILLGSQPASVATLSYVKNFITLSRKLKQTSAPLFIFVFCADHLEGKKDSLFSKVVSLLESETNLPSFLSIIPFSFQKDQVIAPLFHRSLITCSRSGGGTAMELMAVSTGEIWIHSETKNTRDELTLKQLLKGIPVWESESALYLLRLKGAKIVTPETFSEKAFKLLQ